MRFLADECCDVIIVAGLREDGHDVLSATEVLRGTPDPDLLDLAIREQRVLITEDRDFGMLVIERERPCFGIIYLRLDPAVGAAKLTRVREILAEHVHEIVGSFLVAEPGRVRTRPLPDPQDPGLN